VVSWKYEDDDKDEEEADGKGGPRASHHMAGEVLLWEDSFHYYKATHFSGYVTGLGLSRVCITPLT
jgi:hypothetical protein